MESSMNTTMAIITAMQKSGSTEPSKYLAELKKSDFSGVTGRIAFDDLGDIKDGAITMYQFKNGTWVAM